MIGKFFICNKHFPLKLALGFAFEKIPLMKTMGWEEFRGVYTDKKAETLPAPNFEWYKTLPIVLNPFF